MTIFIFQKRLKKEMTLKVHVPAKYQHLLSFFLFSCMLFHISKLALLQLGGGGGSKQITLQSITIRWAKSRIDKEQSRNAIMEFRFLSILPLRERRQAGGRNMNENKNDCRLAEIEHK